MTEAVCRSYLTWAGTNSDQTVKELICEESAESLADELLENWGPVYYWTGNLDSDGEREMADVSRDDLISAMSSAMSGYWNC